MTTGVYIYPETIDLGKKSADLKVEAEVVNETGRNIWDDYSPPHFGFKPKSGSIGSRPVETWHWNSETFCLAATTRYASYMLNRIDNIDPAHSKWSGYASIYWSDSDAERRHCPTDEERVDFAVTGPVIWRDGFNAGKLNTTNNLYLDTECDINRVAIRSTFNPGMITVTASRKGLKSSALKIESKPVEITGGLMLSMPQTMPGLIK
jgi:hypothetical protein